MKPRHARLFALPIPPLEQAADGLDYNRVTVHFLDISLDVSTPIGQLVMTIVGAVSRWEAAITSERNTAAAARLRAQNRPTNGTKRTGFKIMRSSRRSASTRTGPTRTRPSTPGVGR